MHGLSFDEYIEVCSTDHHRKLIKQYKISEQLGDALVCIRNAVIHNANDLSNNKGIRSLAKVEAVTVRGYVLKEVCVLLLLIKKSILWKRYVFSICLLVSQRL